MGQTNKLVLFERTKSFVKYYKQMSDIIECLKTEMNGIVATGQNLVLFDK